jgi:hypothetical protein
MKIARANEMIKDLAAQYRWSAGALFAAERYLPRSVICRGALFAAERYLLCYAVAPYCQSQLPATKRYRVVVGACLCTIQ